LTGSLLEIIEHDAIAALPERKPSNATLIFRKGFISHQSFVRSIHAGLSTTMPQLIALFEMQGLFSEKFPASLKDLVFIHPI